MQFCACSNLIRHLVTELLEGKIRIGDWLPQYDDNPFQSRLKRQVAKSWQLSFFQSISSLFDDRLQILYGKRRQSICHCSVCFLLHPTGWTRPKDRKVCPGDSQVHSSGQKDTRKLLSWCPWSWAVHLPAASAARVCLEPRSCRACLSEGRLICGGVLDKTAHGQSCWLGRDHPFHPLHYSEPVKLLKGTRAHQGTEASAC